MQLSFEEAEQLLKRYGIKVVETRKAIAKSQAVKAAQKIGYPVVLKIDSPDIIHKTDVGGVKTNLFTPGMVADAYDELMKKALRITNNISGVIVQKQLKGHEIIIGGKQDLQFGPVVLFGLGGIFVEILEDISLRIAPLTKKEALRMIKETKAYKLLKGVRGSKPANINDLVNTITKVGNLLIDNPLIKEIDLNPCFINEEQCIAADLRIIKE